MKDLLKNILPKIRHQASTFEADGSSMSYQRVSSGVIGSTEEVHGFRNCIIYLENGIGLKSDLIAGILSEIDKCICGFSNSFIPSRYMFRFGGIGDELYPSKRQGADGRWLSTEPWKKWIEEVAGSGACNSPGVIHSLFKGAYSGFYKVPGNDDLLIFFGRTRDVLMPKITRNHYASLRRKAVWFFIGETDSDITVEMGNFMPEILEATSQGNII